MTPPDLAAPTVDELGYDMLNTGATVPESVLETLDQHLAQSTIVLGNQDAHVRPPAVSGAAGIPWSRCSAR